MWSSTMLCTASGFFYHKPTKFIQDKLKLHGRSWVDFLYKLAHVDEMEIVRKWSAYDSDQMNVGFVPS